MQTEPVEPRVDRRRWALAFLSLLGAFLCGYIWNSRTDWSPNDRSRWNTVWSLVDFGDYQIYPTPAHAERYNKPRQFGTIDRVVVFEPGDDRSDESRGKAYSSKPPLLPTVIAGYVRIIQKLFVGEPFGGDVTKSNRWPALHVYTKSTLYLFQVAPFLLAVWLYAKFLERFELSDGAWWLCMASMGAGTFVTGYMSTLNNHVIGASFAFIVVHLLLRIWFDGQRQLWRFFVAGLCAGWAAANELPAGLLVVVALLVAFLADWKKCLAAFIPGLAIVTAAFFITNLWAIGDFRPAYLNRDLYDYPGSHFSERFESPSKSAIDALNDHAESLFVYFLHMTVGHHGVFSLTPILAFAAFGAIRLSKGHRLSQLVWLVALVSAVVFAFFWIVNNQRNYGGFCHGMRWLMWLAPLWLLFLPAGVQKLPPWASRLAVAALAVSIFSVADTLPGPWSYSWLHETMKWMGIVDY